MLSRCANPEYHLADVVLQRNAHKLFNDEKTNERYKFIFLRFKPAYWYWEVSLTLQHTPVLSSSCIQTIEMVRKSMVHSPVLALFESECVRLQVAAAALFVAPGTYMQLIVELALVMRSMDSLP